MQLFGLLLLCGSLTAYRFKRQALPSTHVAVHSLDSNVLVSDFIHVVSSESRIDFTEKLLTSRVWSGSSHLIFDTYDSFANLTATRADAIMDVQNCAQIHTQAGDYELAMHTNRDGDGHTTLCEILNNHVNLSIVDEGLNVEASCGEQAQIDANTWLHPGVEKEMSMQSVNDDRGTQRQLVIMATSELYQIKIMLMGAQVHIQYGTTTIEIEPDYKTVHIYTEKYPILLQTAASPFEITMNARELNIRCPDENANIKVTKDVDIHVGQYSKLCVERGGGHVSIGDKPTPIETDTIDVESMDLGLTLLRAGQVKAQTRKSHIEMKSALQNVGLTSAHHNLLVNGGIPHMRLETGNVIIEIDTRAPRPTPFVLMPPFVPPVDQFAAIGPLRAPPSLTQHHTVLRTFMPIAAPFTAPELSMPVPSAPVSPPMPPLLSAPPSLPPQPFRVPSGMAGDIVQSTANTRSSSNSASASSTSSSDSDAADSSKTASRKMVKQVVTTTTKEVTVEHWIDDEAKNKTTHVVTSGGKKLAEIPADLLAMAADIPQGRPKVATTAKPRMVKTTVKAVPTTTTARTKATTTTTTTMKPTTTTTIKPTTATKKVPTAPMIPPVPFTVPPSAFVPPVPTFGSTTFSPLKDDFKKGPQMARMGTPEFAKMGGKKADVDFSNDVKLADGKVGGDALGTATELAGAPPPPDFTMGGLFPPL